MRVLLTPQIFPDARPSKLGVLCDHGLEGRHRLQVTDAAHPVFQEWLSSLEEEARLEWDEALEYGTRNDGIHTSAYEIAIVKATASDWDSPCPRLVLEDALDLMGEKFRIILEGDAEDRDFLRCMSTPEQYQTLCDFETKRRCLEIVLGGGLGSMTKKAEQDAGTAWARYRRWYLFDSDGLRPTEESDRSRDLREICEEANVPCLQLRRRMIENYIPSNALREWVYELPPRKRGDRKRRFEAFMDLGVFGGSAVPRRYHFNMKTGFTSDRDRKVKSVIFGDLSNESVEALQAGFGSRISRLFAIKVRKEDLVNDGSWNEINPEITQLIALIR